MTGSPTKTSSSGLFHGQSHTPGESSSITALLAKPSSSSVTGSSSAVLASLTARLAPPNTSPADRISLSLSPSRQSSPPKVLSPTTQLAHNARVVVGSSDALLKSAEEDAREAAVGAFGTL
ncbi:hypothetical protein FRC07_000553 [Ceratobasidium sp. 392]|nr:hypothetical protein FRC07_000553 [Ceratobasidium sp. 392]